MQVGDDKRVHLLRTVQDDGLHERTTLPPHQVPE